MADRPDWRPSWPEVPEGHEVVAVADTDWLVVAGKRCRWGASHATGGRTDRHACGKPSVAELLRGTSRPQWWAYCGEHLYGRWIENGQVMHRILKKISGERPALLPGSDRA